MIVTGQYALTYQPRSMYMLLYIAVFRAKSLYYR
jgi:hypothetical protein